MDGHDQSDAIYYKKVHSELLKIKERDEHLYSIPPTLNYIEWMFNDLCDHLFDAADAIKESSEENYIDDMFSFLESFSISFCVSLELSQKVFKALAFEICLKIVDGNLDVARGLFNAVLYPIITAERLAYAPVEIGKKGGRSRHQRRDEAISLAKTIWENDPSITLEQISSDIHSSLTSKYTDAPARNSILSWIRNSEFRPK